MASERFQIRWTTDEVILTARADRLVADILHDAEAARADWVVIERPGPYLYAFRPHELRALVQQIAERAALVAVQALNLHEWGQSPIVSDRSRPFDWPAAALSAPSTRRLVALDLADRPVAIGEMHPRLLIRPADDDDAATAPSAAPSEDEERDEELTDTLELGPLRGPSAPAPSPAAAPGTSPPKTPPVVDAVLSAEAPAEIATGADAVVDVRLELAAGAAPLPDRMAARIGTDEQIAVLISVDRGILEVVGARVLMVKPPTAGNPVQTAFQIRATAAGSARIAIMFRQGASDLGTLVLSTTVVAAAPAGAPRATAHVTAAARNEADDDVLLLLVDEEQHGDEVRYRYRVYSKPLGVYFQEFGSAFVKERGAAAVTPLAYVRSIYQRIVDRVLVNRDDLANFAVELQAIGIDMCRQLFDDAFLRFLWDQRAKIQIVQVTSWEPYIPWELLRLQHPDTREDDGRFLSEYRLIRTLNGRMPRTVLPAKLWQYLLGSYPAATQDPVGGERDYLATELPKRGISTRPLATDMGQILAALRAPEFDVLHIACHGSTDMSDVDGARLVIGDRQTPQGPQPVTLDATTVRRTARLEERTPLVFLNACETGEQGASLTDWGGWPRAFCETGAGAFIGTSWSVRERPATTFATAFYDAMLDGRTLAEAAGAARSAAKQLGDASWLAFVVYGHPMARLRQD